MSQGSAIESTIVKGVVSDTPSNYIPDEVKPLSLSTDGRVRVLASDAPVYLEFFHAQAPFFNVPKLTNATDGPWALDQCNPWA